MHLPWAMVELDRFKPFNDRFSHQAGDATLQSTVEALNAALLPLGGFAARLGDEECCLLEPGTPPQAEAAVLVLAMPHPDATGGGPVRERRPRPGARSKVEF